MVEPALSFTRSFAYPKSAIFTEKDLFSDISLNSIFGGRPPFLGILGTLLKFNKIFCNLISR